MTLVTTPGSASADSYASLAQALAYHAARGNAAWVEADDTAREPALRRGTAWLEATYRARWPGYRGNGRAQALDWPRYGVTDLDGWVVDPVSVPVEVINATCEAALRELSAPGSLSPDYVASEQVASTTAGPVSVTFRATGGVGAVLPILTVVDGILSRIIGGSRNIKFLLRS